MKFTVKRFLAPAFLALSLSASFARAADDPQSAIKRVVDKVVQPVIDQYRIPGMAVGIVLGNKTYVFNYGLAVLQPPQPVTGNTLFEVGSISKTFTATLTAYAQLTGHLDLNDPTSKYLPSLQETKFGSVRLLNLGTHTPGGVPLQVPDEIRNDEQLIQYLSKWSPAYKPGTYRTYSNVGVGTLGLITAKSMKQDFATLMEQHVLQPIGMTSTYLNVPGSQMSIYAQGYTKEDRPIRMAPAELWAQAYGIRTTAADLLRYLEANLNLIPLDEKLQRAVDNTHTGYFKVGAMTQDLMWEQYAYPPTLESLLQGNSPAIIFEPTPVTEITPPEKPREDVWINKTGSTNGFGAYVAFVPSKRMGIVILANKSYPISERVTAAFKIVNALSADVR